MSVWMAEQRLINAVIKLEKSFIIFYIFYNYNYYFNDYYYYKTKQKNLQKKKTQIYIITTTSIRAIPDERRNRTRRSTRNA